jgi:3-methylcrotonyl-CoA carboxylase alpha subunit
MGQPLAWPKSFQPRGHAIECRLYAENAYQGGIPSTGKLLAAHWPQAPGRRFEVGFEPGDEITSHYDPMIAKIIVWDETRTRAIQKMKQTLSETVIFGVRTNIPLLQKILSHVDFITGKMTTRFFETNFSKGVEAPAFSESEKKLIQNLGARLGETTVGAASETSSEGNPWSHAWRPN